MRGTLRLLRPIRSLTTLTCLRLSVLRQTSQVPFYFQSNLPVYYGLSGKSCNETRLTGGQNSCRLNRRSRSWHRIEEEARLPHKLSSLLFVVEWHASARLHA